MKTNLKALFSIAIFMFAMLTSYGQGTTTAGMNGRVVDTNGESLPGATILAVHTPTGSQFGGITDDQGYYRLPNMGVGGPYKVTVSYVGFESYEKDGIYLSLGQTFRINVTLGTATAELAEVAVVGSKVKQYNAFDGNKTGAETVIGNEDILAMPSINRDLTDFTRLTPQATVRDDGAISIAGINNRYNAISIDGAVNNDVFGLSATGTNGGQTGGSPISMDAIEQFQVVLAPFDVRQSGFAGASINAVTRSGSNTVKASAYYYLRNEGLAGVTPNEEDIDAREKLPEFSSKTYGFRVGAPIIKNKLFVFASAEIQREETPANYTGFDSDYTGDSDRATIDQVTAKFIELGYDPGDWEHKTRTLDSDKFLLRFDWNISQHHKLMARHSYTKLDAVKLGASNNYALGYSNNAQYFPSVTNSSAIELKSNFDGYSNNLILGFTSVKDDRDPYNDPFPALRIYDGSATIYAGSEPYSTANALDQDVLTLTDNFSIYKGKHTITLGANLEYSNTYNLFMRKNFGEYRYSSVADFLTVGTAGEVPAYQYERGYSLVDDVTGDGSEAAAIFSMIQWGIYAQDEFQLSDDFKLTAGLRVDMPMFMKDPIEDTHFNTVTKPLIDAEWGDLFNARAGEMPKGSLMFSPRIGFNWDVTGEERTQVRGGVGIFTSRVPLVWPGGSYTNNGTMIGGVYHRSSWGTPIEFRSQWDNQYKASDFGGTDAAYGGQVDLFAKDFKFPQMFRASAAIDQKLPLGGLVLTAEGLFTKTLNNVLYYNVNVAKDPIYNLTGADERPYYDGSRLDGDYTRVMFGTNTNKGYTYNFTLSLRKPLTKGFSGNLAYTFGRAMAVNDGTSSQNSSQWRYMEQVNGLNDMELSYSDFDLGHRVVGYLNYRIEYLDHLATTVSLYYNGQSGRRFSYIYSDRGNLNGNGESDNNLIYIPASQSEIVFDETNATAAEQWADLDEFIKNDDYLSQHRGDYAERNGARNPVAHIFDFKILQDIFVDAGPGKHTLQISFDIFNLGNMLNNKWGLKYYTGNDYHRLINFEGFDTDGTTPMFSFSKPSGDIWQLDDSGISSSRWQAQLGVRYIF